MVTSFAKPGAKGWWAQANPPSTELLQPPRFVCKIENFKITKVLDCYRRSRSLETSDMKNLNHFKIIFD